MMQHCPGCGALLDARLVAAIRNPDRTESCPRQGTPPAEPMPDVAVKNLGTYMLALAILREAMAA